MSKDIKQPNRSAGPEPREDGLYWVKWGYSLNWCIAQFVSDSGMECWDGTLEVPFQIGPRIPSPAEQPAQPPGDAPAPLWKPGADKREIFEVIGQQPLEYRAYCPDPNQAKRIIDLLNAAAKPACPVTAQELREIAEYLVVFCDHKESSTGAACPRCTETTAKLRALAAWLEKPPGETL